MIRVGQLGETGAINLRNNPLAVCYNPTTAVMQGDCYTLVCVRNRSDHVQSNIINKKQEPLYELCRRVFPHVPRAMFDKQGTVRLAP